MHLSGMKWVQLCEGLSHCLKRLWAPLDDHKPSLLWRDIAKFITHFIVEEIDENTSMEDLQKMMVVALVYRVLVCVYEVSLCTVPGGRASVVAFLLRHCITSHRRQWCNVALLVAAGEVMWRSQLWVVCQPRASPLGGSTGTRMLPLSAWRLTTCVKCCRPIRRCASGAPAVPRRGSFCSACEWWRVTHPRWSGPIGSLLFLRPASRSQREWLQNKPQDTVKSRLSWRSESVLNRVPSLSQVHSASTQQELLHCFPLPRLHHSPLLPAQQDCVRCCGGDHCGPVQRGQIASGRLGSLIHSHEKSRPQDQPALLDWLHLQAGIRRTEQCVIYSFSH